MKIVIAPDSFKESLTAKQVCVAIEQGFRAFFPDANYVHLPLADGGEGTVDVLLQSLGGEWKSSLVEGPTGAPTQARWALIDNGKTALIELAAASGLDLVATEQRNPMVTSTYGTGQLILEALNQNVDKILLGLGGSATNDGGAGIVHALGGQIKDSQGNILAKGGAALGQASSIDLTAIDARCKDVEMVIACDVTNPLCGLTGASHVFGPQKGASPSMVETLDQALSHFATIASEHTSIDPKQTAGYGAAGGAPLGLSLAFDIKIKPGIEMILDTLNADSVLANADLLITGEGQMDNQTLQGKTPWGVAQRAKAQGIPVIAIAGSLGSQVEKLYGRVDSLFGTVRSPQPLPQVLAEAESNLIRTARNVAATLHLGRTLV